VSTQDRIRRRGRSAGDVPAHIAGDGARSVDLTVIVGEGIEDPTDLAWSYIADGCEQALAVAELPAGERRHLEAAYAAACRACGRAPRSPHKLAAPHTAPRPANARPETT